MRDDVLSWDQYFMGMAHLSAKRSKDPNTRVGACIVNPQKEWLDLATMVFLMVVKMRSFLGIEMVNFLRLSILMLCMPN